MTERGPARGRTSTWPGGQSKERGVAVPVPRGAEKLRAVADRLRAWSLAEAAPGRFLPRLAVAFGLGIALYFAAEREPALWAAAAAGAGSLLTAAALRRRGYSALIALGFAALAAGFFLATLRTHGLRHPVLPQPAYSVALSGFVSSARNASAATASSCASTPWKAQAWRSGLSGCASLCGKGRRRRSVRSLR